MGLKTFDRGVHPFYYKELTASARVEKGLHPKTVIIPLSQHAGTPCEPLVKKGDVVYEGQKIGDVHAFVSAPVHASISGKVKEVELYQTPVGTKALSVVIEGDGSVKEWAGSVDLASLSKEAIREAVREAGIVGMGGAAFPTSVKLALPKGRAIDTVLLNGCECEPFLSCDHRVMTEEPDKVIWGLRALMKATGAQHGIVGVEDNKPDALDAVKRAIGADNAIKGVEPLRIIVLETKYPQGAEKMLIKAALGRKVPLGKLPLDAGVIVNNVGTAVAVFEALNYKKPLIERVVTVSGDAVMEPKNLKVRLGATFEDVIAQCGGLKDANKEVEVLNGGPMMGIAQTALAVPVVKGTSGVTVLSREGAAPLKYYPCIKCARCVEACPMGLMPYKLGDQGREHIVNEFKEWGVFACIECGCCSYVCPARRPLVQWIRVGKTKSRRAEKQALKAG